MERRRYNDNCFYGLVSSFASLCIQSFYQMTDSSKYLIEILEFYIYKLKGGKCTKEEIDSATKVLESNMEIHGTISDFANFYGVSESNVRANITRKLFAKPKRVLLYPFHKFIKIVPESWRKK